MTSEKTGGVFGGEFCGGFSWIVNINTGVSKNNGTPKWMIYKGKPY